MMQEDDIPISFDRLTPEWMAGFFDGEGSVMAQSWDGRNSTAGFTLTQKDPKILAMIMAKFCGVGEFDPYKGANGAICHRWRVRGRPALSFLKTIQPHVICKKRQVDLAVCLLEAIASNRKRWQSDEDHQDRLAIEKEIKRLNQEGNVSGKADVN